MDIPSEDQEILTAKEETLRTEIIDLVLSDLGINEAGLFEGTELIEANGTTRDFPDAYGSTHPIDYIFTYCFGENTREGRHAFVQFTVGNEDAFIQVQVGTFDLSIDVSGIEEYREIDEEHRLQLIRSLLEKAKQVYNPEVEPQSVDGRDLHQKIQMHLGIDPEATVQLPEDSPSTLQAEEIYKVPGTRGLSLVAPTFSVSIWYAHEPQNPNGVHCFTTLTLQDIVGSPALEILMDPDESEVEIAEPDTGHLTQTSRNRIIYEMSMIFEDIVNDTQLELLKTKLSPELANQWSSIKLTE